MKNNAFATGHDQIDDHHEELFHLISSLDKAVHSGEDEQVDDIIAFLEHYVKDHFKEEEDLMLENDYTGYDHHKKEHLQFVTIVTDLRNSFNDNKPLPHIIFAIRKVIDALVRHIQTVDVGISKLVKDSDE